jgi:uncharacterized protein YabE (DUF348 family)
MDTVPIRSGLRTVARAPGLKATALFLAALLLMAWFLLSLSDAKVILSVDGESRFMRTFSRDVAGVLSEAGITVGEADLLSHPPVESVKQGMTIEVRRAFPVTVLADDDEFIVWVAESTVEEALDKLGIGIRPLDHVEPELGHILERDDVIDVTRVYQYLVTHRIEVPFREVRRGTDKLDRGETRVIQRGSNGVQEDTEEITLMNGLEAARELVQSELLKPRQDRIVEFGENTLLSRGGRTVSFLKVINVTATAYCPGTEESGCPIDSNGWSKCTGKYNDGYTYTGVRAVAGTGREDNPNIIAVDPRVIPLGSRVYIDGYGYAVAADIGGAIKGNRIDLLFDDHDTAWWFGRKRLRVYLLP